MPESNPILAQETKTLPGDEMAADPEQPRKTFGETQLRELGQNMLPHGGPLVPLIVFWCTVLKKYILLDGERRWRAGSLVGIKQFPAVVLAGRPSAVELNLLRLSLDVHHVAFSAMEFSDACAAVMAERKIGVTDLAAKLNKSQGEISKSLTYQKGCPELKELLRNRGIPTEKAYEICREPDFNKQRELLKLVPTCTREQLKQKVNGAAAQVQVKVSTASFAMPGGVSVAFRGKDLTLETVAQVAGEFQRIAKKSVAQGICIRTQQKMMADVARPKKAPAAPQEKAQVQP